MARAMRWIGSVLLGVFVIQVVVGIVGLVQGSLWGIALAVCAVPLCAGALLVGFSGLVAASERRKEILRTGLPAMATIQVIDDTGRTEGEDPVARLGVLVVPDDGATPFESTCVLTVPRLKPPQEGQQVRVRYDPADHAVVAAVDSLILPAPA